MDLTHPSSGQDKTEDPIKISHPEEEEHHESRASKMFGKVKARAKKFKNSLTKHGNEHDHDVVVEEEEEDEDDKPEPEKHVTPVNETSAVKDCRTSEAESLSHPRETNVPASEEIIPSGTKDLTAVSSYDDTRRVEPEPLRDATYEHEAPSYPVRTSDVSEREDSRETQHAPLNTPVSLLSAATEGVKTASGEDESLSRQQEVNNTEMPKILVDDLSGESTYQSKIPYHPQQGVAESLDQKSGVGTELEYESAIGKDSPTRFRGESETELGKDLPAKSHDFDQQIESGIGNDSPTKFYGQTEAETREDFLAKNHDFDQQIESGICNDSPTRFYGKTETETREDFPAKSHDFDQKIESGIGNDSPTRFGGKSETETREDFPAKFHEFEQTIGSGIGKDTGAGEPGTERREDFLGKNYEFEQELESAIGNDSPTRLGGESGLGENFPAKSDDVKVETGLGRDLSTRTKDQFSPEFSGPNERDDFDSQAEQTRYEAQEPRPGTYTEMVGSATSFVTDKAIATKNAVASSLGYSDETVGGQHKSPVVGETFAEKLTTQDENVASPKTTKLPLSGGGYGAEEREQEDDKGVSTRDSLAEKLTPEEEDKAFSEMVAEKLNLGGGEKKTTTTKEEEVAVEKIPSVKLPEEIEHEEEGTAGGGMVGRIKGAYNYWLGGTTEEVKPKSPVSVEESSQSLGSTIGTKGFSDSGESGLGETGGSTGAVPVQKGL